MNALDHVPTYDEMKADGWDYHRNGVSGCGFFVRTDGPAVLIRFNGWEDDHETVEPAIIVPFDLIRRVAEMGQERTIAGRFVRGAIADRFGVVCFDTWEDGESARLMVGITDLSRLDQDPHTAAFDVELLLAGEFRSLYNAWRGDRFHKMCLEALGVQP